MGQNGASVKAGWSRSAGGVMVGPSPLVPCHGQCAWGLRVLGAGEPASSAAAVGVGCWAGGLCLRASVPWRTEVTTGRGPLGWQACLRSERAPGQLCAPLFPLSLNPACFFC